MNNIEVRALLEGVRGISADVRMDWTEILNRRFISQEHMEREVKAKAADMMTHKIVGDVMRGGVWEQSSEPEGETFRLRGYWLTYQQLVGLMQLAYDKGRTKPIGVMAQTANPSHSQETKETP